IMLGEKVEKEDTSTFDIDYIGVKASQFSFARLHKADPVLGVDMSSTGEVGCLGKDFDEALLNAMISVGHHVPKKGVLVSSGDVRGKVDMLEACRLLAENGHVIYATKGTAAFLHDNGIDAKPTHWPDEKGEGDNVEQLIADHKVDLVINIPKNHTRRELTNGYRIRRWAIDHNVPLLTNARLASAFVKAFINKGVEQIGITPWKEY
ncbi:MAG: carbamoyl phosphate synthase large subunit, partial [Muribaculaceae bacterium]|nr:carbamoyl phosphate synthase large subunit [Muribaculaceae bacterium]